MAKYQSNFKQRIKVEFYFFVSDFLHLTHFKDMWLYIIIIIKKNYYS